MPCWWGRVRCRVGGAWCSYRQRDTYGLRRDGAHPSSIRRPERHRVAVSAPRDDGPMPITMQDYRLTWTDAEGTPRASAVAYDKPSAGWSVPLPDHAEQVLWDVLDAAAGNP